MQGNKCSIKWTSVWYQKEILPEFLFTTICISFLCGCYVISVKFFSSLTHFSCLVFYCFYSHVNYHHLDFVRESIWSISDLIFTICDSCLGKYNLLSPLSQSSPASVYQPYLSQSVPMLKRASVKTSVSCWNCWSTLLF